MLKSLVLYAPNVHTGGGLVLLAALLKNWRETFRLILFLDVRASNKIVIPVGASITWVSSSVISRALGEIALSKLSGQGMTVLCFHGLPPILPNKSRVLVFLQNSLYVGSVSWTQYRWSTRIRLAIERFACRIFRYRVTEFIVQTPSMKLRVGRWYGACCKGQIKIKVLPFIEDEQYPLELNGEVPVWDFIYVADGEAHKNHRVLLAAWQLLAQDGLHPSLALTLSSRDLALRQELADLADNTQLRIKDLGQLTHKNVLSLYSTARALIFPSTSESFGLPLIEASNAGLPILASELDYVRDVCSPVQTFDPTSPVSIARAVRRFLTVSEPALKINSPQEFWCELLGSSSA